MFVKHTNGLVTSYNSNIIYTDLLKLFSIYYKNKIPVQIMSLVNEINHYIFTHYSVLTITSSEIRKIVQKVLHNSGWENLSDKFEQVWLTPDPTILQDYIYYSKYAREGENWDKTVQRVMKMYPGMDGQFIYDRKVMPSMRSLQFAGPAIDQINDRMYNCTFTLVNRPQVFGQIMYLLLCGCGVGYSIQKKHISQLPPIQKINKRNVYHYTIEDSILGWKNCIDNLMSSYFSGYYIEFDYSKIRPEGSKLITSGGIAPGHLPLKNTVEKIRQLLDTCTYLKPIHVHDIICYLASAVLAGGIRRSSLISIFSADDLDMLYCKSDGLIGDRHLANNSAALYDLEGIDRILNIAHDGLGEPGIVFLPNENCGVNPCGEIGFDLTGVEESIGYCNLTSINASRISSKTEFLKCCEFASDLGWKQQQFNKVLDNRNLNIDHLLGVSVTGIYENLEVLCWMEEGATLIRNRHGESARTTCIKPSGTESLLLGTTAGIHPSYAKRFLRLVKAGPNEPARQYFEKYNSVKNDYITFPLEFFNHTEVTGLELLEKVLWCFKHWILPGHNRGEMTHNVSCTIPIQDSTELKKIKDIICNERLRALSFVPANLEHKYINTPCQRQISVDDWNAAILKKVDWSNYSGERVIDNACDKCG